MANDAAAQEPNKRRRVPADDANGVEAKGSEEMTFEVEGKPFMLRLVGSCSCNQPAVTESEVTKDLRQQLAALDSSIEDASRGEDEAEKEKKLKELRDERNTLCRNLDRHKEADRLRAHIRRVEHRMARLEEESKMYSNSLGG